MVQPPNECFGSGAGDGFLLMFYINRSPKTQRVLMYGHGTHGQTD